MSNAEIPSEDQTILAALEALERSGDSAGTTRPDEISESDTLARLYTEVLGLMPFELAPEAPSPEVHARLMSLIQGDETQPAPAPSVIAAPPVIAVPPVAAARSPEARVPPRLAPSAAARRAPSRWPLALAAILCLLLIGLSAWLYSRLGAQSRTIAQLEDQLMAERARISEVEAESRKLQASALSMKEKLELVTSPAVEVSPMRPVGEPPLQPGAHGILFVKADHQHWHMTLHGLQPVANGQAYKLWFLADQGPVSGGAFTAQPGAPMELSSERMPAGTKGVLITLEEDPQATAPTGPEILRAAAVYQI